MSVDLAASYAYCRRLNAAHGKTFYLATLLLPKAKRPAVHALYAYARHVDDLVDVLGDLDESKIDDERIRPALDDAVNRFEIPVHYFDEFLASMRMDTRVTEYATYAELKEYMWGSAAVIGLQMLPVLGRVTESSPWPEPEAVALGYAFQLTNFIRDVGEDLRRGRLYLPGEDLARFGVSRADLERASSAQHSVTGPIRELLTFEIERTRELYALARGGITKVHRTSRDCLRTAITLYGGILDQVERNDYDVLRRRAQVGPLRRGVVGTGGLIGALWARATSPPAPRSTG
ncbi:MAG TPA: phytoene/squalene synthase family protein [Jatrophihabitans sp.]